jgi:hypothetical protein
MAFQLGSNFKLDAQLPLDVRTVVSNQTERNALISYPGLIVYVTSENKYYYYNGVSWVELNITGGGGSANFNFTVVSSSQTLTKNTRVAVDTSSSSFTINLPTANLVIGDTIEIIDYQKTFDINNLIIAGGSTIIESSSAGLTCNIKEAHFLLIWLGSPIGWRISIIDNNYNTAGVIDNSISIPLLYLDINTDSELFDSNDSTNYKIPWNRVRWFNTELTTISSTINTTKAVTYNPNNKNIYVREPGIYNVDLRFGSFNMIDSNDFLRARLRSAASPIEGGLSTGPPNPPSEGLPGNLNVLASFAQGPIGVTQNGEAMCAGFTTLYLPDPIYIIADFLHFGAFNSSTSLNRGFPVFNNVFGNRPFLFLSKIVSL